MISTRSYYSPDIAAEFCRHSGQPLPLVQAEQVDHHNDADEGLHGRPSPSSEIDGKSNSCHTRRRVPVACQRCRKRKIKCSGDPGNGQGCSNCRSAGAAPNLCTFLRVNSRLCETYLTVRGAQGSGRYSPYAHNQSLPTRGITMQVQSGGVPAIPYANVGGGFECYNSLYGSGFNRGNYSSYPLSYDDETYSGQSPPYLIPNNNEPISVTNSVFANPISPKTWNDFSGSGRTHSSVCSDQNPASSISLSTGSFSGDVAHFPSNTSEVSPTLSSGGGSATAMATADRVLPNPAMARCQQPGLFAANGSSFDGLTTSNSGYRISVPWFGSDGTTGSNQPNGRSTSINFGSAVDGNEGSDGSSTANQDSFSYLPVSHSALPAPLKAVPMPTEPGRPEIGRQVYGIATHSRSPRIAQESTPSPENSMGDTYGYSSDVVMSRRSARGTVSSGPLANGQEYTRLRPLPTPASDLYRTSQQESTEYQSQLPHRTSIASLSSSVRY